MLRVDARRSLGAHRVCERRSLPPDDDVRSQSRRHSTTSPIRCRPNCLKTRRKNIVIHHVTCSHTRTTKTFDITVPRRISFGCRFHITHRLAAQLNEAIGRRWWRHVVSHDVIRRHILVIWVRLELLVRNDVFGNSFEEPSTRALPELQKARKRTWNCSMLPAFRQGKEWIKKSG